MAVVERVGRLAVEVVGLVIEEPHEARAVVGEDALGHVRWDPVLTSKTKPLGHVVADQRRRLLRREAIVRVRYAELVLHEELGVRRLPEVVVVRHRLGEQRIAPDRPCRLPGQVAHHDRMVERPRGLLLDEPQGGVVAVGEVEQRLCGRDPEERRQERQHPERRHTGRETACETEQRGEQMVRPRRREEPGDAASKRSEDRRREHDRQVQLAAAGDRGNERHRNDRRPGSKDGKTQVAGRQTGERRHRHRHERGDLRVEEAGREIAKQ